MVKFGRQEKAYIKSKPQLYSLIKVLNNKNKYEIAVNRVLYLKNNYSVYDDDNILLLVNKRDTIDQVKTIYDKEQQNMNFEYYSFFSNDESTVKIKGVDELLHTYLHTDDCKSDDKVDIIEKEKAIDIIKGCLEKVKEANRQSKILKDDYLGFFYDEIRWIKDMKISNLGEYQTCVRRGRKIEKGTGPSSIKKNSRTREIIYSVKDVYDEYMDANSLMEEKDKYTYVITKLIEDKKNKFSHIVVLQSEDMDIDHIEFVKHLSNFRVHATISFFVDLNECNKDSIIVKNGRVSKKSIGNKVKVFNLIDNSKKVASKQDEVDSIKDTSLENFKYIDLRHHKSFNIARDYSNVRELIVKDDHGEILYSENELKEVPVYSNIAAGEPIYIESEQQDNFYIPEYWLKGMKECFILKVKGDSMIDVDINDGDYIVIRRQQDAKNNDIVAVNLGGSATLKRLSIGKDEAFLLPENKMYEPIPIDEEEGVIILGKAIGIIKH